MLRLPRVQLFARLVGMVGMAGMAGVIGGVGVSGCLHGNIAPTAITEVRVRQVGGELEVSWPRGVLTELRLGVCRASCAELGLSDPSSEFSELVPMPDFAELNWHIAIPAGTSSPLLLGALPDGATEIVAYSDPTGSGTGGPAPVAAVAVVVEVERGDGILERFGAANLP